MQDENIIKTIGEEGEEVLMKIQEMVTFEGKDYALLSVVEDGVESDVTVLMRVIKTNDEFSFEQIESDEEFKAVAQALNEDDDEDDEE